MTLHGGKKQYQKHSLRISLEGEDDVAHIIVHPSRLHCRSWAVPWLGPRMARPKCQLGTICRIPLHRDSAVTHCDSDEDIAFFGYVQCVKTHVPL